VQHNDPHGPYTPPSGYTPSAGAVVDQLVQHVDVAPTLLAIAGQDGSRGSPDGRSILPLLRGEEIDAHSRSAYAEVHNTRAFAKTARISNKGEMYSVIRGAMKLIHVPLDPRQDELYDLANDPSERHNLVASMPDVAAALLADLNARNAMDHHIPDPATLSVEARTRLEALGYLEPVE
jgi:arylsulfatase A-like enzyme